MADERMRSEEPTGATDGQDGRLAMPRAPEASVTLARYQASAARADRTRESDPGLVIPLLGLFGEAGSLLSEAKKKHRDAASYLGYEASVVEELGDVLWYMTILADRASIRLSDVAANAQRDFMSWDDARDPGLTFAMLGPQMARPACAAPSTEYEGTLLKLAGQVGLLLTRYEAGNHDDNRDALSGDLVAVLRLLLAAAREAGVTLDEAARRNMSKVADRWPEPAERIAPQPFDELDHPDEQLPRKLAIEVFERSVGGRTYVLQRCNAINIGDRLTDNIMLRDDYRFHDVFHYAYAAVLGWSPVMRSLFRLKRKSRPDVDEGEDGARAALIEEGVTTWIFNRAKQLAFFEGIRPGDLPLGLLKGVRSFVTGYECEECPLWLWEEAILQGYEAFRFLKRERRGILRLDMPARRLTVEGMLA